MSSNSKNEQVNNFQQESSEKLSDYQKHQYDCMSNSSQGLLETRDGIIEFQ